MPVLVALLADCKIGTSFSNSTNTDQLGRITLKGPTGQLQTGGGVTQEPGGMLSKELCQQGCETAH